MKALLCLLAASLLLCACREELPVEWEAADSEEATATHWQEGDVNALNPDGITQLTELSRELRRELDDRQDALRDEDEEMAEWYLQRANALKPRIGELLRRGADPWARGIDENDQLAPCARQYWPAEFVEELHQEGIPISDTP